MRNLNTKTSTNRKRPRRSTFGRRGLGPLMLAGFMALAAPKVASANEIDVHSSVEFTIECSLREAIANHNAHNFVGFNLCRRGSPNGSDTIVFDIPLENEVFVNAPVRWCRSTGGKVVGISHRRASS